MFGKNKRRTALTSPDTIIGAGTEIHTGLMTGVEPIRVNGIFKGNVDVENCFSVGRFGDVTGDIKAMRVVIAGTVKGNIHSSGTVYLTSTANVTGNIKAASIVIDDGAIANSKFSIGD